MQLLAFLSALALLVCNAAAGLASRLAGGLAFAAAAVLSAVAQVAGFNGLNVFHEFHLPFSNLWVKFSTAYGLCQSHFSYLSTICI